MSTSAQALNEVLSFISKQGKPTDRFVASAANYLGLEGPGHEAEALKQLSILFIEILTQIDALPHDDTAKNQLKRYMSQFNGIVSFGHMGMDVNAARKNFLKSDNLVGLMNVHMALSGHFAISGIDREALDLAAEARCIRLEIADSQMPERVKFVLMKRLSQVASIVDHFGVFGLEQLQQELEALVGALVVNRPAKSDGKEQGLIKRIAQLTSKGLSAINKVDKATGSALKIAENADSFVSLFDKTP